MRGGDKMDCSYLNHNGKKVSGAAATNNYIYTVKGGIDNYNKFVGEIYIRDFVNQHSIDINNEIEKDAKRSKFKVI